MFGDAALGETNLAMIATARSVGAAAKFTGSGGAIVALCPAGAQQERQLQGAVDEMAVLFLCYVLGWEGCGCCCSCRCVCCQQELGS